MRQTITQKDIDRYSSMIIQNKVQGAVAVYEELRQKGYSYAGWAHGVATGESVTGRAALGFLTDTANRELTQAEMDGIRIGMANGYLNALSANMAKPKQTLPLNKCVIFTKMFLKNTISVSTTGH